MAKRQFLAKRVLVKLSGEALAKSDNALAIDRVVVDNIASQLLKMVDNGIQVGVVVGGGNFWRGASAAKNGIPRNRADYIGMLATIMNAIALQSSFENHGIKVMVQSSIVIDSKVAENYVNEKAIAALEKGKVVIFAGGTGRPFFTTDTASTLVAAEIGASTILMGKNGVDGIYDSDPKVNSGAKKYATISYDDLVSKKLGVMDTTAASMAKENDIDIIVFNIKEKNSIWKAITGQISHTKVGK